MTTQDECVTAAAALGHSYPVTISPTYDGHYVPGCVAQANHPMDHGEGFDLNDPIQWNPVAEPDAGWSNCAGSGYACGYRVCRTPPPAPPPADEGATTCYNSCAHVLSQGHSSGTYSMCGGGYMYAFDVYCDNGTSRPRPSLDLL